MRILYFEFKKIFSPFRLLLTMILLCSFCFFAFKSQCKDVALTDTTSYPDQITIYDTLNGCCSIDLLFHDYLLDTYGNTITKNDIPRLTSERELLLNQIVEAAAQDPILLRNGVKFYPDGEMFIIETQSEEEMTDAESEIASEDYDYILSCANGQTQLYGTSHPAGFLTKYQSVINYIRSNGSYHVMSYSLLEILKDNYLIIIAFACAALLFIVPYGVNEAKSHTEGLTASMKNGKNLFLKRLAAAQIVSVVVICVGIVFATLFFASWNVSRYYGCDIGDVMDIQWGINSYRGMSFGTYYGLQILIMLLLGLSVNTLACLLSFRIGNSVTAIACTLPLAFLLIIYHFAYNALSLVEPTHFGIRWESYIVVIGLAIITVVIVAIKLYNNREVANC